MRKQPHSWTPWKRCPAVETPEEERERTTKAPPGQFEVKICERCGRIRVRKVKD